MPVTVAESDTTAQLPLPTLAPLFIQMNSRFFNNEIPSIPVEWSTRMTRSAGIFWWKRYPSQRLECGIRLSAPLLAHRPCTDILATLTHEMIHAWIALHVQDLHHGHGPLFRRKLECINRQSPSFRVTRHHRFLAEVQQHMRYRWDCLHCGQVYRRQRRTIDPKRHRCGRCSGRLQPQIK